MKEPKNIYILAYAQNDFRHLSIDNTFKRNWLHKRRLTYPSPITFQSSSLVLIKTALSCTEISQDFRSLTGFQAFLTNSGSEVENSLGAEFGTNESCNELSYTMCVAPPPLIQELFVVHQWRFFKHILHGDNQNVT